MLVSAVVKGSTTTVRLNTPENSYVINPALAEIEQKKSSIYTIKYEEKFFIWPPSLDLSKHITPRIDGKFMGASLEQREICP